MTTAIMAMVSSAAATRIALRTLTRGIGRDSNILDVSRRIGDGPFVIGARCAWRAVMDATGGNRGAEQTDQNRAPAETHSSSQKLTAGDPPSTSRRSSGRANPKA